MARLKELEAKAGSPADVVVLTAGLHYLHLWPAVKFEAPTAGASAKAMLRNYSAEVAAAIRAIRAHVGPRGTVIWKNTNDVCEVR